MIKNSCFLQTRIISSSEILEKEGYISLSAAQKLHWNIFDQCSKDKAKKVHKGVNGIGAFFSDPVFAIDVAVKMQKLHNQRHTGPVAPRVVIYLLPFDEDKDLKNGDISEEFRERCQKVIQQGGSSEILLDSTLESLWLTRGNRKVSEVRREVKVGEKTTEVVLLPWQSHTVEPRQVKIKRSNLYLALAIVPALIILFYLVITNFQHNSHKPGKTLIIGPLPFDSVGYFTEEHLQGFKVEYSRIKLIRKPIFSRENRKKNYLQLRSTLVNRKKNKFLIIELVELESGLVYNRLKKVMESESGERLRQQLLKGMKYLLSTYKNPVDIEQFADIFSICGFMGIPKYIYNKDNKFRILEKIDKLRKNCIKDILIHLPERIQKSGISKKN
ncbi:MAG: hypothetical protein ACQES9_02080 [Myxococcota bacterium]